MERNWGFYMFKKQISLAALFMSVLLTVNVPVYLQADNTPVPLVYKSYFNSSTDINQLTVRGNATLGRTPYLPNIQNFGGSVGLVVLQGTKDFSFNSAFINEKVDISRVPDKGISSFIEFDVYRGSSLHTGDWFSFVLSKDTNILTQRNAASINNSLSILLSFYREMPNATRETDNYTNLEASIFRNLNGSQNLLTNYVVIDPTYKTELSTKAPSQLVRKYKFWFDYNATSRTFEIRLRFDNSYARPQTPVASFTNIDASFLGDTFFAGITGSTGGLDYGLIARQWLFANRSLPNGIDPSLDPSLLIDDTMAPTIPTITPVQTETGWRLNPASTDDSMSTIIFEYQLDGGAITTQDDDFEIPDGTRQVKIWARDIFNKSSEVKTVNFYQLTYRSEGGTQPDVTIWYPEQSTALFPSFTKLGHTHEGFTTEQSNQQVNALTSYTVTQDATLYAKYSANTYTISYDSNSELTLDSTNFLYNETIEGIPQPERLGYIFEGWYKDQEFETIFADLLMPAEDFTLYAKWSIVTYDLILELNGGTVTTLPSSTFNVETETIVLPIPTRNGYVFSGWYTNPTFTSSVMTSLVKGTTGHQTFYAQWNVNQAEIDAVIALINEIDTPITLASYQAIQAAVAAYYNLLPIQQERVTNQGLLFQYEADYAALLQDINNVIDLISPLDKVIELSDQEDIEAAREAYEALTEEQKDNVTNLQVLLDAEAALLSLQQTEIVIDILDNLPDLETITLEDKDAIEAAREAFDALTPSQQANISNELRQKLLDAEAALAELEQPQGQVNLLPIHALSGIIITILYFIKAKKEGK